MLYIHTASKLTITLLRKHSLVPLPSVIFWQRVGIIVLLLLLLLRQRAFFFFFRLFFRFLFRIVVLSAALLVNHLLGGLLRHL